MVIINPTLFWSSDLLVFTGIRCDVCTAMLSADNGGWIILNHKLCIWVVDCWRSYLTSLHKHQLIAWVTLWIVPTCSCQRYFLLQWVSLTCIYLYLKVKFNVEILSHIPGLSAVEVLKHIKIFLALFVLYGQLDTPEWICLFGKPVWKQSFLLLLCLMMLVVHKLHTLAFILRNWFKDLSFWY